MAYPTVSGPYGFLPEQNFAGRVYNAATVKWPIPANYASNIGFGDLVSIQGTGEIVRVDVAAGNYSTFNGSFPPIGIFLGCEYEDAQLKYQLFTQGWLTQTNAINPIATICNDDRAIFKVAVTDSAGVVVTSSGLTQSDIGKNAGYVQGSGTAGALINTATLDSVASLDQSTINTTATLPWRIYAPVTQTVLPDGTYCEAYVMFNWGTHFYQQPTGI